MAQYAVIFILVAVTDVRCGRWAFPPARYLPGNRAGRCKSASSSACTPARASPGLPREPTSGKRGLAAAVQRFGLSRDSNAPLGPVRVLGNEPP